MDTDATHDELGESPPPNSTGPTQHARDETADNLLATAYHEAGHAVAALAVGRLVKKVTIEPKKSQFATLHNGEVRTSVRLGACELQKGRAKPSKTLLDDEVLILFAGMVAESQFTGQYCTRGAAQDLRAIRSLLGTRATNLSQLERLERRMLDKTEHLLQDAGHAQAIEWIAHELVAKTTIKGRSAKHFFTQALQRAAKG